MFSVNRTSKGLFVSKAIIAIVIACCLATLLLVGLLCGFLARNDCSKTDTTTTTTTTTTRTPTTTVNPESTTRTYPTITIPPTSPRTTTPPIDLTGLRLPTDIIPINYNLDMKVYFDPVVTDPNNKSEERFEGRVIMTIRVINSTQTITFHCDPSLKILDSVQLTNLANNQVTNIPANQHFYDENQFYKVQLDSPLAVGDYYLQMDYQGDFGPSTNLVGFYKTVYSEDGVTKQAVATKYEPLDARRAFPCFDEPGFKASYEIAIEHPQGSLALSNWPESPRQSIAGGRYRTTFDKTYPMATYLAAWSIVPEDFGVVAATSQNGKPIRIFARKSAVEKGLLNFAADVAKRAMDFFENVYFDPALNGVPPKIDHIALPDFSAGAMEHWGIITYRETALLFSDDSNTGSNKQSVAEVIAHELAHFWFGNLVTCKWWDEIWLNEAMAQFLQNKAANYLFPDWELDSQFITNVQIPVMFDDGLQNTVPIENPVYTSAQIGTVFNSITYSKGASVLRMLESTVGEENFRQGLNNFLKQNEFGSAVSTAFYDSLVLPSEMAGVTAQQYMETWIKQTNYPEVALVMGTNTQGNTRVFFYQKRFLLSQEVIPDIDFPSPFDFEWLVYVKCRAGGIYPDQHAAGSIREFAYFLNEKSGQIDLDRRYSWVKCNNDFKGYYVTDYSAQLFQAFDQILASNPEIFSVADRANLIHNAFSLCLVGVKSYATVTFLTEYMEFNENDLIPWKTFTYHMGKIAKILEHRPSFQELRDFGTSIVWYTSSVLNLWENSGSHVEKLLKSNLIDFLCRMQEESNLRKASEVYSTLNFFYFINPNEIENSIPPYLRDIVYKYHIQNTYNYLDFLEMNNLYGLTVDAHERAQSLTAMSYSRLVWILDLILESLIKPNPGLYPITPQDFFDIINQISRNPTGRYIAWWFIRNHWYDLEDIVGYSSRSLANTVKVVCDTFENEFLLEQMNFFFSTTQAGVGASQRQQALEIVSHNIYFVKNREKDIIENLFEPRRRRQQERKVNASQRRHQSIFNHHI